jgi:hypothetical protein
MRKAQGVFLWVVLVVRMLNEQFDEGRSHFQLLDVTSNLPGDLVDLIGKIISDGAADPRLLPTLILIFSGDIMSTDELVSGINLIAGGVSHLRGIGSAELPFMKRFIVNASKGLVEWVGGTAHCRWRPTKAEAKFRQRRKSELCHVPSRMVRDFHPKTRRQRSPAAIQFRFHLVRSTFHLAPPIHCLRRENVRPQAFA